MTDAPAPTTDAAPAASAPTAADPAPLYALGAGALLILTGVAGYLLSKEGSSPVTALIPAGTGTILISCGLYARRGLTALKQAMHAAAGIGLLGAIAAVIGMVMRWEKASTVAISAQLSMALICAGFVALCVKSFRDTRKRREAAG
ncbi:MAG: hypothetical protein AAF907_08810 [Planctomycetota bacterium]